MKLLLLAAVLGFAAGASLSPRDEAAELLLETAELDKTVQEKRELSPASKRSYSTYGGYQPNFDYHEPQVPAYPAKAPGFDLWGFKQAILGALYQAVRAVAGGSIAVKGQLIKGGGNLIATQGRLIASGGQAVSNFGRSVSSNAGHTAALIPATYQYTQSAPAYSGYGGYSSGSYNSHQEGPGVLATLTKAKVGVASAVGSAVGNAVGTVVSGAGRAVGNAVVGTAGAVAGAISGAADAVSNHVANKFTPSHDQHTYVPAPTPIAYKPLVSGSSAGYQAGLLVVKPIKVAESTAQPVDTAATYGGSLDESFGSHDIQGYNGYNGYQQQQQQVDTGYGGNYAIQPSISYDLH